MLNLQPWAVILLVGLLGVAERLILVLVAQAVAERVVLITLHPQLLELQIRVAVAVGDGM